MMLIEASADPVALIIGAGSAVISVLVAIVVALFGAQARGALRELRDQGKSLHAIELDAEKLRGRVDLLERVDTDRASALKQAVPREIFERETEQQNAMLREIRGALGRFVTKSDASMTPVRPDARGGAPQTPAPPRPPYKSAGRYDR